MRSCVKQVLATTISPPPALLIFAGWIGKVAWLMVMVTLEAHFKSDLYTIQTRGGNGANLSEGESSSSPTYKI